MKNQTGFTLLETIIYISLFSIIIGGAVVATYQIIQSIDASHNHVILQQEASFLLGKMDWALTGATSISASSSTLTVSKSISGLPLQLTFAVAGSDVTLQRNSASAIILNTSNVLVSSLSFAKTNAFNGKPESIAVSMTLAINYNGRLTSQDFHFIKYLP